MLSDDPNQALTGELIPVIAGSHRLQWEQAQDCHVILYPEGMVKLSASAAEILQRCDGEKTLNEILEALQQAFPGADLEADVFQFLEVAHENGWVQYK